MKQLHSNHWLKLIVFLLFILPMAACTDEEYAAGFAGTYKGEYTSAGINLNNIVVKVTDKGGNDLGIEVDLGAVSNNFTAKASSATNFNIPDQQLNGSSISGGGNLSGTTLTFSYTQAGGAATTYSGTLQ